MNRKPITAIEKDMKIEEYLRALVERGGSDLHLKVGRSPLMRIEGDLHLTGYPLVRKKEMEEILSSMLTGIQRKRLEEELELDFSYVAENMARFRVNMFYQLGTIGAVMRIIPSKARGMDDLGLPEVLKEIALSRQGLILITGPTGSGKTTTLAAIIDYLNRNVQKHIVTIEDPVEYIIEDQKCTINQREVGIDTRSFSEATKRAMRQDPDIILVGEMRDPETIHAVLSAADTGHLALSTLHTNYAKQSISRIIDSFPPDMHNYIRVKIAMSLIAVITQRLVKRSDGLGRVAVMEIMMNTPTIKRLIIDGKLDAIDKAIASSTELYKMQTINQHLFKLVEDNVLSKEDALDASSNPNDLRIMFQTQVMNEQKKDLSAHSAQAERKTPVMTRP